ncbi:iron complex transport system permease protein [Pullulanibacillus pueri]|uniref:Ferrichrome ABC transporter permease n=1 Tax=Pullulanibacillus pueri TaxID=1437324 RepID=A0A8J3ELV8_9BACL|nr:iron ABC transporter permease [Pullulanibacillus pueri]MBM7681220.1 iron complex transport system permease protein [Pullulanibacillus pueri]GGH77987.1 ferrichrome ABC transporter permease [Pullulanibacillus pueri]
MSKSRQQVPFTYKLIIGILVLMVCFILSMCLGAALISMKDIGFALFTQHRSESIDIIREIRFPREIGAILVGAALSVAGAIMQGLTRNPLADPGLLGLTAGANAALALCLALIPKGNYFVLTIACFIGATVGVLLVLGIGALKRGGFSPFRIVLAGAAVSAFLEAIATGIALTFKLSKDVSMWTAGGLIGTAWNQLAIIAPFILVGILVALLFSRQLTVLSLNEELAIGLGQHTRQIKAILYVVIVLLAGASVALVGNMAFIGLMIPHMVRPITGTDYRYILPISAIFGASFMSLADTLGRTLYAPFETPVAAIIAVIGLPFFLFVVHKGGKAFS